MTKVSTAKKKGREFESACCAWINNNIPGTYCTVRAKEGAKDEGDIRVQVAGTEGTIECKNYSDGMRNRSGLFPPNVYDDFQAQTLDELVDSGADWAVLIVKADGCGSRNPKSKRFPDHEVHIIRDGGLREVITLSEWSRRVSHAAEAIEFDSNKETPCRMIGTVPEIEVAILADQVNDVLQLCMQASNASGVETNLVADCLARSVGCDVRAGSDISHKAVLKATRLVKRWLRQINRGKTPPEWDESNEQATRD